MARKTERNTMPTSLAPLFEVLTRRPDGHETVHRLRAPDADSARAQVVESGVPADMVVEVVQV